MEACASLYSMVVILLTFLCLRLIGSSNPACGLPDMILPSERVNITMGDVSMPIGIAIQNWQSGRIGIYLVEYLIQEVLGYNTVWSAKLDTSVETVRHIAGCLDPAASDPQCGISSFSRSHVAWEVWWSSNTVVFDALWKELKAAAPVNLGTVGFDGLEGMYVFADIVNEAYEDSGLPIAYYKVWNATWNDMSKYFISHTAIDVAGLKRCEDVTRINGVIGGDMEAYLHFTGDVDGVETVDGKLVAKCDGGLTGHWWLSPACRLEPTKCVPVTTAGNGWGITLFMFQATAYNMRLALATALTWTDYTKFPRDHRIAHYWWQPDATFIDKAPIGLVFPPTDTAAWAAGDRRTQQEGTTLTKVVHYDLQTVAPRVKDFMANMEISLAKLNEILLDLKLNGVSEAEAACNWLKNNMDVWQRWIPDATACRLGDGIVDIQDGFVSNMSAAVSCSSCAPGRFSEESDDKRTHLCSKCPSGKHSGYRSESCQDCSLGRFAADEGSASCAQALAGQYVPKVGSNASTPCPQGTFTPEAGAASCLPCDAGLYADSLGSFACKEASVGYYCPLPGSETMLPCEPGTFSAATGQSQCSECGAGTFTNSSATTECTRCAIGKIAVERGSRVCRPCSTPSTSTTGLGSRSEAECVCEETKYYHAISNDTGSCKSCPEEMTCVQGSTERSLLSVISGSGPTSLPSGGGLEPYPTLQSGFWSSPSDPFSIFKCWSDLKCPGGAPGSCAPNIDLTKGSCYHCIETYYWNGQECFPCSDTDKSKFVFPGLLIVVGFIVTLAMYNLFRDPVSKWNSWQNKCVAIVFLGFNHYQVVSLLQQANVEYQASFEGMLKFWSFTQDAASLFNVMCGGFGEFQARMIFQSLVPVGFFLIVALAAGVYFITSKMWPGSPRFELDLNRMINVFFSVLFTYFVGIASMSMALFQCKENPNKTSSLSRDLSITCYEGDWNSMVIVGALAVLVYCCGLWALFTRVLYLAIQPKSCEHPSFAMRWKFLLIKFRPEVHWWALVFLGRCVLLNLSFVIFVAGVSQIYWMITMEMIYLALSVHYMPWRFPAANQCSLMVSASIVVVASSALPYVETDADSNKQLAIFAVVVSCLPSCVSACLLALSFWRGERRVPEEQSRRMCSVFHAFSQDVDQRNFLEKIGEYDRWHLQRAASLLETEFLGLNSGNRRMESRRPLQTEDVNAVIEDWEKAKSSSALTDKANLDEGNSLNSQPDKDNDIAEQNDTLEDRGIHRHDPLIQGQEPVRIAEEHRNPERENLMEGITVKMEDSAQNGALEDWKMQAYEREPSGMITSWILTREASKKSHEIERKGKDNLIVI